MRIKTFEARADVRRMLQTAGRRKIEHVYLCNQALRRLLREKGYGRKTGPIKATTHQPLNHAQ